MGGDEESGRSKVSTDDVEVNVDEEKEEEEEDFRVMRSANSAGLELFDCALSSVTQTKTPTWLTDQDIG